MNSRSIGLNSTQETKSYWIRFKHKVRKTVVSVIQKLPQKWRSTPSQRRNYELCKRVGIECQLVDTRDRITPYLQWIINEYEKTVDNDSEDTNILSGVMRGKHFCSSRDRALPTGPQRKKMSIAKKQKIIKRQNKRKRKLLKEKGFMPKKVDGVVRYIKPYIPSSIEGNRLIPQNGRDDSFRKEVHKPIALMKFGPKKVVLNLGLNR